MSKLNIYTYTTEDEDGTKTYAFIDEASRDAEAIKWIVKTSDDLHGEDKPCYKNETLSEAYEHFTEMCCGPFNFLFWDNHSLDLPAVEVTIEVNGGICEYEVKPSILPVTTKFKDYDNINAGDPDEWTISKYNQ